jgi:hypothetical protein
VAAALGKREASAGRAAALADKLGHDVRAAGQTVWADVAW